MPFIGLRSPGGSHADPAGLYKLRKLVSIFVSTSTQQSVEAIILEDWGHTGICQRNRLGVDITKRVADGRNSGQEDGAGQAEETGTHVSWSFVRSPAEVAEGSGPELRVGHDCERSLTTGRGL